METVINKLNQNANWLFEACAPRIKKNRKTVYSISVAVTLTLLAKYIHRKLTVPPKALRGLPRITYIELLKGIWRGESIYDQRRRVALPLLDKANGIFLEPTHLGWQIRSANPIFNKYLLSDIELFPKAQNMFGSSGTLVARFVGGGNVGNLEGEVWKRHRKIMNPVFHRALPVNIFGQLSQKTFGIMEQLGLEDLRVTDFCERMTLDAIGLAGFGFDFEAVTEIDSRWLQGYDEIRSEMTRLFFILFQVFDDQLKWIFPARVNAHKNLDHLLERIDEMIAMKRITITEKINSPEFKTLPDSEKDLLTLMIEAELQGEGKLSDMELRKNIVGFFFAGHDTTSSSLSFAIAQMGRNKEIQRKAREEVIAILGDQPEDVLPTVEETKQMKYLDAIIKETLRLNSPLTNLLPRVAAEDIILDNGFVIPKGSYLDVDVVATHLYENNWENASEFIPERYLSGQDDTSTKNGLKWAPFGYGSHQCLGMNFSYAEQRVFLSMLREFYKAMLSLLNSDIIL
ncbi:unnamed protein product [Mucor hiemalis]